MQELLKQVSRSFYLTLHILPRAVRSPLSLAYLLARATDTVADTQLIDVGRRREMLRQLRTALRDACQGGTPAPPDCGDFINAQQGDVRQGIPGERVLIENFGNLLRELGAFSREDRHRIGSVLEIITGGQEKDVMRFGAASKDRIIALNTDAELDEYTYDVAGCVGEFWTHTCRAHLFPAAELDVEVLFANAARFGKGLQLVNILRDLPGDLRQGRCYLPNDQLLRHGLNPQDLLVADSMDRFRPLYLGYLRRAEEHLEAGWHYTAMLPFRCVRIRLACAWPILIGVKTIDLLRRGNILDEQQRIKVGRSGIRRLMFQSVIRYPNRRSWNRLFQLSGQNR